MIQDLPKAARFLLTLLLICFVSVARAQTPANLTGVYNGKYTCSQGATNLKLSLVASADGDVTALFTFYLPPGTQQQGYTYSLHGDYNLKTSKVSLSPVRWETQQPAGFNMVGMNGTFDGGELSGAIYGAGCSAFNVQRDEAESTNIAAVIAAQTDVSKLRAGLTPAPVQAPAPPQPQEAYKGAAPAPAPEGSRSRVSKAPAAPPSSASATPPAPAPGQVPATAPASAPSKDPYMAALRAQAPAGVKVPAPPATPAARPSTPPATTPPAPPAAPKATAQAAPSKAAPAAPAPNAAAKTVPPPGPIKYFCFTTDPKQRAVYLTDIYDVASPATNTDVERFMEYEVIKGGFNLYLFDTYKYMSSDPKDDQIQCVYQPESSDKPEVIAQNFAAKKESVTAQAAAAGKQVVATGWKYTDKTATMDDPKAVAAAQTAGSAKTPTPASGGSGGKATDAQGITWAMNSTKDQLTGAMSSPQPKSFKLFTDNGFVISMSASCASNGVGVFFQANALDDKNPNPEYAWYDDQSDNSGEQIADVRIVVDGGAVHVAQGWPQKDGHTLYTNNLGLLFYEPNIVAHSTQEQEDSANTGILALDGLLAPYVRQAAKANAQDWADNSAGPMTNLVNAKSVRVELPITGKGFKPIIELNPQDKVLHPFLSDCYAKFTSGRR